MAVELKIPESGESITEVQIGSWLKQEGDFVEQDEVVVEIETDKASMELPAPTSGILKGLTAQPGDIVQVGSTIARIEEGERPASSTPSKKTKQAAGKDAASGTAATATATKEAKGGDGQDRNDGETLGASDPFVMPAARRALTEAGLQASDVKATGPGGRLLKEDVERHVAAQQKSGGAPPAAPSAPTGPRQEETVPMTMLRRRIAQRLVESQQTAAMLTTFNEIDMSAVIQLRKDWNEAFQKKHGVKLGFMSLFVKAAIDALKLIPAVNGEIRGNDIVYKNYYDIGIAVSTEHGLVVPVLRNTERLSFAEIELAIGDLATRARDRKITVEELQGGTFTITNGGIFGSMMSTPIINPPQSGILGLHAIKERPIALDGQVVIRPMMYVALTYDHRLVDGRESVTFLKRIKECIEDPARMLIET
jgi:2-oxoglutarate dehydrogenase E2 component (dihydrolipoamide succinyltransferase)